MLALVLAVLTLAAAGPQELTVTASDGVPLACALVEPDGAPPAGGWPAVVLFHGLGESHANMEPLATQSLAPADLASLMCDARGTGGSGGRWGLDGPREVQDARDELAWLAARPEVSDTQIGAFGISLGGGLVWNAAAAGVPFKAIVPAITWTNLQSALAPGALSKSGAIQLLALAVPSSSWDPELAAAEGSLLQSSSLGTFDALAAARSPLRALPSISTPTLLVQGRHDFLFDIDQAKTAYGSLAGPKALYIGDLGHAPATNPAAEAPTYVGLAVKFLRQYLAGGPAAFAGKPVILAHDPWDGKTTIYPGLPATKKISVALPGTTRLKTGASVDRGARLTGGPHETFGAGTVTVHFANGKGWDRLVAVVSVPGQPTPITEGGVKLSRASGVATIRLMDESILVPAGKRVVVTLGATSSDLYATNVPAGSSITLGRATLTLSTLTKAVSR
jgi:pimeloyl-ACP methyl ester carboxylesterase